MTKKVYLDQWVWIKLAQVHYGKSKEWSDAYEAVMASADAGTATFPLSISHLKEIAKRRDDASRGRLVDFMMGVWNANAIRPWSQMLIPEARNAVRVMMGEQARDLSNFVFGNGIPHVVGGVPTWVAKHPDAVPIPPAILQQIEGAIVSPNALAWMKDSGLAAGFREGTQSERKFAANVRAGFDAPPTHPDKMKRRDIAEARFMANVVGHALVRAMMEATSDPRTLIDKHMSSRGAIRAVRESMPTFNTFYELDRGWRTARRVKESDLWDFALSIAVPYCDIVATERRWCKVARNAGLDRLYETRFAHTAAELSALLRAEEPPNHGIRAE